MLWLSFLKEQGGPEELPAKMALDWWSPMDNSWKIFEEYHIDENLGFALPNPLVREGTEIMGKMFFLS